MVWPVIMHKHATVDLFFDYIQQNDKSSFTGCQECGNAYLPLNTTLEAGVAAGLGAHMALNADNDAVYIDRDYKRDWTLHFV